MVLKGLGAIGRMELRYKGLTHLRGEQGRLEVHYDPDRGRWYAHASFEVSEEAVRGEVERCPEETTWKLSGWSRHWDKQPHGCIR